MEKSSPIYFIHDEVDYIFEEKGNAYSAFRKVQWANQGSEPDVEKAKYEIRKWYAREDGEMAGKGFTFSTPEGPDELVKTMIEHGFGETKDILLKLKNRDDFKKSVEHMYDEEDVEDDGEYFDAREALIS